MTKRNILNPETIAAQADGIIDKFTGGVVPPIQPSTTYARDADYALYNADFSYGRDHSSVVKAAENILMKLEEADDVLLFPSGMAAIAAIIRTLNAGDQILLQSGIYWGTSKWIREFCERRAIMLTEMDCSDIENLTTTILKLNPNLVLIETPSNPWLQIIDIEKTANACKKMGSLLMVDSTAATPILSKPLNLGADIVVHSASKAINGHADVLAGVLCTKDKMTTRWQAICTDRHDAGAVIGNFEAWLLIRGMRTLSLRVERMCTNALTIALFLQSHTRVGCVLYPGLINHENHELAEKQMQGGFGHLLSFQIKGNKSDALQICGALNIIHRATSLGGVESLIEHRKTIEGDNSAIPENLLRLSVGIEHIDDLINDLTQALVPA